MAGGGPGAKCRLRNTTVALNLFCIKLDDVSVPEGLVTTVRVLLMFSTVLKHDCGSGHRSPLPPGCSGAAHDHPKGPYMHPCGPLLAPMGLRGTRGHIHVPPYEFEHNVRQNVPKRVPTRVELEYSLHQTVPKIVLTQVELEYSLHQTVPKLYSHRSS